MDRDAPPPLHFTRQWTQPTHLKHQKLLKVVYPPQRLGSPFSSPLQPSRSPLSPSALQLQLYGSSARPTRRPLELSSNASPLPSRPLPSSFVEVRRTARSRTSTLTCSPVHEKRASHSDATVLHGEDAGRLFWQQQAQRFEEANRALRQELNAVYRVLNSSGQRSTESIHDGRREMTEGAALHEREWRGLQYHGHHSKHESPNGDSISYETVVQERNVARIALAQEREKSFLLRHRLREAEMAAERLEQRLRAVGARLSSRTPTVLYPSASAAKSSKEKVRYPTPSPSSQTSQKSRRSDSRSASRASLSSSLGSPSRSSFGPASSRPRASSPRHRSATRRNSSCRSCVREGKGKRFSSVESSATEFSEAPRLSRGHTRLHHKKEVQARRASSYSSARAHRSTESPSPVAPAREELLKTPPSSLSVGYPVVPQRESSAQALLSSLLTARPTLALQTTLNRHRAHSNARPHLSEVLQRDEASAPRHVFRSQLFGKGDATNDQGASSISEAFQHQELGHLNAHEASISRQLMSPTPPLLSGRSPAWTNTIPNALVQRP
ncbi:hypothetical protein ABL78_1653 [Leptomonas seymouri]|uniref:Uncharacterized protein n=1 Tax=Leptomonas seymouri TaxID=5684 RepID=A0A0N1IAB4_LEPSE|nr:hypothetical protein ABL78_1653 [Leptomonas seymouri]|eukprot:KPI89230.1 hypothetical protein ABL78_1653 [Leptomonas seymouri]